MRWVRIYSLSVRDKQVITTYLMFRERKVRRVAREQIRKGVF